MASNVIDWNNPLPGNVQALTGEIDRLLRIRDRCNDAARDLRLARLDTWTGPAASAFQEFRHSRFAKQLDEAGDAHERAAEVLTEYRDAVSTLQPLCKRAVERARCDATYAQSDAEADIVRWQQQINAIAADIADRLREASDRLDGLRSLFANAETGSPSGGAPRQAPQQHESTRRARPDTNHAASGHHMSAYELRTQATLVSNAILNARFVSEDELGNEAA